VTYSVGYFVGSLSAKSINRTLSKTLVRLAPQLKMRDIPIKDLPLYNRDLDENYPPEAQALKQNLKGILSYCNPDDSQSEAASTASA
jgi:chromate reductase, NAD(P)H dehydrogenase (quinone)